MRSTVTLCALAVCTSFTSAQRQTHAFAQINGVPIHLDFYPPVSGSVDGPAPLIIWIHGGGWRNNSRVNIPAQVRNATRDGFAVASVDYRLTSQADDWNGASVTWPAQIHDVHAAVRYLRANAQTLGINPCAFVSWGSSAGGHLSAVLGTGGDTPSLRGDVGEFPNVSDDVQLSVDFYGPSDLLFLDPDVTDPPGAIIVHDDVDSPESILLGAESHGKSVGEIREHIGDQDSPWPALVALARSAAPARLGRHVQDNVPMYIAHGTEDRVVAFAQSATRLTGTLDFAGTPYTFVEVEGSGHGLPPSEYAAALDWIKAQVAELPPCDCPADLSGPDGVLNIDDIMMFLDMYSANQEPADFAAPPGAYNIDDVLAYLDAFAVGCP